MLLLFLSEAGLHLGYALILVLDLLRRLDHRNLLLRHLGLELRCQLQRLRQLILLVLQLYLQLLNLALQMHDLLAIRLFDLAALKTGLLVLRCVQRLILFRLALDLLLHVGDLRLVLLLDGVAFPCRLGIRLVLLLLGLGKRVGLLFDCLGRLGLARCLLLRERGLLLLQVLDLSAELGDFSFLVLDGVLHFADLHGRNLLRDCA